MKKYFKFLPPVLAAALLTALALGGAVYRPDNTLSDAAYQSASALGGDVVIIGIDAGSIEKLGPLPWSRSVMARAIETLNADQNARPAVIGVDVLYTGEGDAEADAQLAKAAADGGNVVVACAANFGSELVTETDGSFRMDTQAVESFDLPYDALRKAAQTGHINSMLDSDGILRHALWTVETPDGGTVPSFSDTVYKAYADKSGLDPAVAPPTDAHGRWYVPFSGVPGDFSDGYSVADILDGSVPADYYAGKIVLIGPYTTGLQDHFMTAADHAQYMYGVEYQANLIEALIGRDFKTEAPAWPQAAVLFAVTALCLLFFEEKKLLPSTLLWLAVSGGWVAVCLLAYRNGLVLHLLWVPLSVTICYVAAVAVNYVRAALERRRVTNTFKRYVAPEIVSEILRQGPEALELGGRLTDVAVLFVDIRGFTTMSESLSATEVVEILNRYLDLTSRCIMQNGGTLDKFIGDATMAFWGAPLPQEDYIYRAVRAALDMVEGAKALSAELQTRYGRSVDFGVGVHCGKAVVGNVGARTRMDYTAIGDTVNTASRLESNAPAGTVYISRAVADALEGRIRATSLGDTIRLKGKTEGFEVLRLDGLTETEETAPRTAAEGSTV